MWNLIEQDLQFFAAMAICASLYCVMTIAWFVIDTPPKQQTRKSDAAVSADLGRAAGQSEQAASPAALASQSAPSRSAHPISIAPGSSAQWDRLMSVLDVAHESQVRVVRLQGDLSRKLDAAEFEFDRMLDEVACYSSYAASRAAAKLAVADQPEIGNTRLAA